MNEYQALARRTQNPDLNMVQRKEHALMGLVSELGEVCAHYQKVHQGHPMDTDAVIKELGDMMWLMAELCDVLRIDMQSVAERNIAKLEGRYPEGFDKDRSVNREPEKPKGLTLKCYDDPDECGYCMGNRENPDVWCTRFDRPCRDMHIDAYMEDRGEEEHEQKNQGRDWRPEILQRFCRLL